MEKRIWIFIVLMMATMFLWAQTNPSAQLLPLKQEFGTTAFNVLPAGFAGWNGLSGASINTQALAEASNPTGNATIAARTTATTTGGMYGLSQSSNGRVYIQSSSNATEGVNQLALAFHTGAARSIRISYTIGVVEAGTGRNMGSVLQYRAGSSGTWTTVAGSALVFNNASFNGGDADINGDTDHFSYDITGLTTNTDYEVRWAHWRSGSIGNSVGLAYDDIDVCALPEIFDVTGGGNYCAGSNGVVVGLAGSQDGVIYQLHKDGNEVSQQLGTGAAISFGHQLEGSFSVTAFFPGTCFILMNGVAIVSVQNPPSAQAGPGQDLCEQSSTILSAVIPTSGIGWWSQLDGSPVIMSDPFSHEVFISGLQPGNYTFRWSIQYGSCPVQEDDLIIKVAAPVPGAMAGNDKRSCNLSTNLEAELPVHVMGEWSKVSGSGDVVFADPTDPVTVVNVSTAGEYIFRWTISNGCYSSSDDVKISFNQAPIITNTQPLPEQVASYGQHIQPYIIWATDPGEEELFINSSFKYNNGSVQNGLPGNLLIESHPSENGSFKWILSSGNGSFPAPGSYDITIHVKDDCNAAASISVRIIVNGGNVIPVADAFYTGSCFFWTNNANSKTATLSLAATLKNAPGTLGDIRTAKVSFFTREGNLMLPIQGAQDLPVGLVDPSDISLGSASATVQYNLGSANAAILNIAVVVSGNYRANDPAADKNITVAVPLPGGQICGGIEILNTSPGGLLAGADGWVTTAGFFVQYNNSLKNPQGKVEMKIISKNDRNGIATNSFHTYIVRSNSISGLSISGSTAQFSAKASIVEIIDGEEHPVEGNCMLQLNIIDGAEDKVAITLFRNKGGIWYASNWNGSSATYQDVHSGNLSVTSTTSLTKQAMHKKESAVLLASAFPNPTKGNARLSIQSTDNINDYKILVRDMSGRLISQKYYSPTQKIIDLEYLVVKGTYLIEVIQGEKFSRVMLVRQ
jgi:hypothetical protein